MGPRAGLDRCGKSHPHWDSIPDRPARGRSLYRLSYRAHKDNAMYGLFYKSDNSIQLDRMVFVRQLTYLLHGAESFLRS